MPCNKKYLLIASGLLLTLLMGVPLLLPSELEVTREIEIHASQAETYSYLVNLDAWREWSPWLEKEPSASFEFSGIPGVVGSSTQWQGEEIGTGRQTLIELKEPYYIKTLLEFQEPRELSAFGIIKLDDYDEKVIVHWGVKIALSYPLGRWFGLFIEDSVAPDFEKGLKNLKSKLETTP